MRVCGFCDPNEDGLCLSTPRLVVLVGILLDPDRPRPTFGGTDDISYSCVRRLTIASLSLGTGDCIAIAWSQIAPVEAPTRSHGELSVAPLDVPLPPRSSGDEGPRSIPESDVVKANVAFVLPDPCVEFDIVIHNRVHTVVAIVPTWIVVRSCTALRLITC